VEEARRLVAGFDAWVLEEPASAPAAHAQAQANYWLGLQLADAGQPRDAQLGAFNAAVASAQRLQKLDPADPGGPFWEAVNRAKAAELNGIASSASQLPTLKKLMARVDSMQPCYFHGGVHRYWGAVVTRTPGWLVTLQGRSLKDAEDEFRKAVRCDPAFVGSLRFWAELKVKADDKPAAVAILREALAKPPAADAETRAYNLHELMLCRNLLKELGVPPP
jgi:tetratricopeptide (TPR) repeat protein